MSEETKSDDQNTPDSISLSADDHQVSAQPEIGPEALKLNPPSPQMPPQNLPPLGQAWPGSPSQGQPPQGQPPQGQPPFSQRPPQPGPTMGPPPGYPPPGQAYGPGPAYPPPGPGPYGAPPYPPGPGYGPGYVAGPISKYNFDPVDARTNKWISILAYFGIFFLIPFLCRPQSRFARVHVNNGILLMVANFVVGYPLSLLCFTPLWPVALILLLVAGSFFGILSIVCLVYCLSDNLLPIPFFSKYLEI